MNLSEKSGDHNERQDKKEILEREGLVYFDIGLTSEERTARSEIKIENSAEFDYFGPVSEELIQKLITFFEKVGDNDQKIVSTISNLIARTAEDTQREFDAESAWVNVRVFLPNHDYDIPRWHKDVGYFEKGNNVKAYKFNFNIKGAPTRFADIIDAQRYDELEMQDAVNNGKRENSKEFKKENIRIRKELMSTVTELAPPADEQAVMYRVNDKDSKVHSEPVMNEPRIFMQVLLGNKEQIEEWKGNG